MQSQQSDTRSDGNVSEMRKQIRAFSHEQPRPESSSCQLKNIFTVRDGTVWQEIPLNRICVTFEALISLLYISGLTH